MQTAFLAAILASATLVAADEGTCDAAGGGCGRGKALTLEKLPTRIVNAKYAVRGEVLTRAEAIQKVLDAGNHNLPFEKIIPLHIGNPQSVGANPVNFHRQVISLLANPSLIGSVSYPADVVARAEAYLAAFPKFGAYSESKGIAFFRQQVADYIARRDGTEAPDIENIYLTDGASAGIQVFLELLIENPKSGVLVGIPQYPLYSGTIARLGGQLVPYYLVEEQRWSLSVPDLENQIAKAKQEGIELRALVVINPGNPTGNVMSQQDMEAIVRICEREGLALIADEVYQDNVWSKDRPFISFRSVVQSMGSGVELASFHSISKGFYGECGLRGAYMELTNIDPLVQEQLLKLRSMTLCANTLGQAMIASIVTPPVSGSPSFAQYAEERDATLASLARKATLVHKEFNSMEGASVQPIDGALYAFVNLELPKSFIDRAQANDRAPDLQYAIDMLEATGVLVVPGSGFQQVEGTHHFRITILPEEAEFPATLKRVKDFHADLMRTYK